MTDSSSTSPLLKSTNRHDRSLLNEYANSMFRHEAMPEEWIASCARYVTHLFGNSIRGRTIIDYAFGRGNWSLAFLNAGARRVLAIDASIDNVGRFSDYCTARNISNIEIRHGNILDHAEQAEGDLVWLYGILHHIEDLDLFLKRCKGLLHDRQSQVYVYHYNAHSLRHAIVDLCRSLVTFTRERDFIESSHALTRSAYQRAKDDLTAPFVRWLTATELAQILAGHGLYVTRHDPDFHTFLHGRPREDFAPHHFLCVQNPSDAVEVRDAQEPYAKDIRVLRAVGDEILRVVPDHSVRKNIALGIFNTLYALGDGSPPMPQMLIDLFLFLARALLLEEKKPSVHPPEVAEYLRLLQSALNGEKERERFRAILPKNHLTDYLVTNRVRL